jgi:hypothetical protein
MDDADYADDVDYTLRDLDLATEFRWQNQDLETTFAGFTIEIQHNTDGLHLLIAVDHNTTRDDIAAQWGTIAAWAERVQRWQQTHNQERRIPTVNTLRREHRRELLELLRRLHNEQRKSYADLANMVNELHAHELGEYAVAVKSAANEANEISRDLRLWRVLSDITLTVYRDLIALGLSETQAQDEIEQALERLMAGKSAYEYGYEPVTRDMVRERLRKP